LKLNASRLLEDLVSLVYPRVCMACSKTLVRNEECICTHCRYHLPRTNYHLEHDNPVAKLFWGRIDIESAAACFLYTKGGNVQQLVHRLKYEGQKAIGITIGRLYGSELKGSEIYSSAEVIVPVPLHPGKLRDRGYNQCDLFAEGLSHSLCIPFQAQNVHREVATGTQTRKSRFDRWKNVEYVFRARNPGLLQGKHILLVDDVVTTGATLEACAQELLSIPGTRVSIAAIACASA
jgi:ComF family protein